EDVERDLELLSPAEDAAVVPRRLPRLVVAEDEGAVLLAVDAVDLAGDAEHAFVAEVDLEGQRTVRLSRRRGRGHAEADLEVRGYRVSRRPGLAVEPGQHHLAEPRPLPLPEEGVAGRAPRDQGVEGQERHLLEPRAPLGRARHGQLAPLAPLAEEALGHLVEE